MSRGAALLASLLVTLDRPTWWVLALAGFLARGGLVLFVLPIVILPTPLGLANDVDPIVKRVYGGNVDSEITALGVVSGLVAVGWLLVGGWIAAATEVALVRGAGEAAREEGLAIDGPSAEHPSGPGETGPGPVAGWRLAPRVLVARLLAHLPLSLAIALGAVRVVAVAYVELTRPAEVVTPLVLRIVAGAAGPLALIVAVWFIGELVGGLAARRIVRADAGASSAVVAAARDVVRHPRSTALSALATAAVLAAVLAVDLVAAGVAWTQLRGVLATSPLDGPALAVSLGTFVGIWLSGLALTGLLAAWRSTAMTFEVARLGVAEGRQARGPALDEDLTAGTFGAS